MATDIYHYDHHYYYYYYCCHYYYLHDLLQQGQLLSISTLQQDGAPQGAGAALKEHERARPSSACVLG